MGDERIATGTTVDPTLRPLCVCVFGSQFWRSSLPSSTHARVVWMAKTWSGVKKDHPNWVVLDSNQCMTNEWGIFHSRCPRSGAQSKSTERSQITCLGFGFSRIPKCSGAMQSGCERIWATRFIILPRIVCVGSSMPFDSLGAITLPTRGKSFASVFNHRHWCGCTSSLRGARSHSLCSRASREDCTLELEGPGVTGCDVGFSHFSADSARGRWMDNALPGRSINDHYMFANGMCVCVSCFVCSTRARKSIVCV